MTNETRGKEKHLGLFVVYPIGSERETHLTNEKSEDKDAGEPVQRHEHVLQGVGGFGVVANGRCRFGCQVETTDVTVMEREILHTHTHTHTHTP